MGRALVCRVGFDWYLWYELHLLTCVLLGYQTGQVEPTPDLKFRSWKLEVEVERRTRYLAEKEKGKGTRIVEKFGSVRGSAAASAA